MYTIDWVTRDRLISAKGNDEMLVILKVLIDYMEWMVHVI